MRVVDLRRHPARRVGPHRRDVGAAAERRREVVDHRRRPPVALVARVRAAERVDHVVGLGDPLVGVAGVVAVEVDRVAAEEVLLQAEPARDLPVLALDDRAVALREQVLELVGPEEPGRQRDAIAAPQGLVEVVEVGAAVLVVLQRAERRAGGHDPERQPRRSSRPRSACSSSPGTGRRRTGRSAGCAGSPTGSCRPPGSAPSRLSAAAVRSAGGQGFEGLGRARWLDVEDDGLAATRRACPARRPGRSRAPRSRRTAATGPGAPGRRPS